MKLVLPLHVTLERKTKSDKKISINKNIERNTHYAVLNAVKQQFTDDLKDQCSKLDPIQLPKIFVFTFYGKGYKKADNATKVMDLDNFSIVIKFTLDALVKHNLIPEDNVHYIQSIRMEWGGFDYENPRAELTLLD